MRSHRIALRARLALTRLSCVRTRQASGHLAESLRKFFTQGLACCCVCSLRSRCDVLLLCERPRRVGARAPADGMTRLDWAVLYLGMRACYIPLRSGWGSDGKIYGVLRGLLRFVKDRTRLFMPCPPPESARRPRHLEIRLGPLPAKLDETPHSVRATCDRPQQGIDSCGVTHDIAADACRATRAMTVCKAAK